MSAPILETQDLSVCYGPAKALFDVSISVEAGQVVALLGANGAGKSSLARSVTGLVPPSSGRVWLSGEDITGRPAHVVSRLGLSYIPEGRGIFPGLSVIDNLRMFVRRQAERPARDEALEYAFELFPVLGQRRFQRAGTLSGGEQQMLALARVLACRPKVVIADEPSLGVAPLLIDLVFDSLERARAAGMTILLIEQFVHRALAFADRCVILQRGRLSWSGAAAEAKDEVLTRYLGAEAAAVAVEAVVEADLLEPTPNGDRPTVP
ncbi:MAG TPA: ABC transporter ATP-binding protein [Acidimicrobiales bacterium]|nr:ABC transporter ATP-binding protein [Acidimicrobiales bacterium]